jgi:hypothetical protein
MLYGYFGSLPLEADIKVAVSKLRIMAMNMCHLHEEKLQEMSLRSL